MANTVEITRLMRHAADLLRDSDLTGAVNDAVGRMTYSEDRLAALQGLRAAVAASAYAEALLRMVAAAMEDEPQQMLQIEPGASS